MRNNIIGTKISLKDNTLAQISTVQKYLEQNSNCFYFT
jgi:hypothetical protein